jgi:hypothetical protein
MEKSSRIVHVQGGDKQRETSLLIWWRGREFKRFRLYVRAKKEKMMKRNVLDGCSTVYTVQ